MGHDGVRHLVWDWNGTLFDDQGENGWWIESGLWWHECNDDQPARIVVRKLARIA